MVNCYLCKDAGRTTPADRILLASGKGICRDHLEGSMFAGPTRAVESSDLGAGLTPPNTVGTVPRPVAGVNLRSSENDGPNQGGREPPKEKIMRAKIKIDPNELRRDAATMTRAEMAGKHGCSLNVIVRHLHELGIRLHKGHRAGNPASAASTAIVRATPSVLRPLRTPAGNPRVQHATNGELITIHVGERILDHLWLGLPAATKGDLLNGLEEILEGGD